MKETDFSSANVLTRLLSSISVDSLKETSDVMTAWKQTLSGIKGFQADEVKAADYGSQLLDHSRIIDLKDEVLVVETDHPGRIQMFQMYKRYILAGLKKRIPGIPVKNIVFKLNKVENVSGGLRLPTREELDRAADAANKAACAASSFSAMSDKQCEENEHYHSSQNKTTAPLPSELQDIFASMKASLSNK